ncbi:uncharacterized protein [Epargyreus clarus]|uniref:uncharacterized protein n=1 Tax=Epargyreus clarus TaxID=520877 RepID=UPI003C30AB19
MILFKIILISLCVSIYQCRLPDKVYCVNQECSEPISKAKTVLVYNSGDADLISFPGNADAKIYQKSAGTNPDLWFAEINGVKGYVNSRFLREYKIYEKSPQFIVPVEVKTNHEVQPDKVQQAHEVFEGTTLFNSDASTALPQESTTFKPVETTTPALAEHQQDSEQNFHDNNSINVPNDESNNVLNQNVNNIPTHSSEVLPTNPDENINQSTEADSTLASITTENPVENVGSISSNEQLPNNAHQNPELPPTNPESLPIPPIVPSSSENSVQSNNVEIPDRVNYLQQNIQKPEAVDNNEVNTSVPSNYMNNVDNNAQQPIETSSETSMPPQNIYITPPPNDYTQTPQVPPSVPIEYKDNILNNMNYGDRNSMQNLNGIPNTNQMAAPPVQDTIPASFIDTQTVANMNENVPIDNIQTSTEGNYFPNTETTEASFIPTPAETNYNPISPETSYNPISAETSYNPISAETSYNPISPETTYTPVSTETSDIPTSTEANLILTSTESYLYPNVESASAETSEESITSNEEATIPENILVEQETTSTEVLEDVTQSTIDSYESTTMGSLVEDVYSTMDTPVSENDNEDGIFSNMYSTLADLWPSSTEAPPPETIFNPEYMSDNEPKDAESAESFSFMAYIMTAYKSVMGSREESRALFATPGETCYKDEYCDGESTENKNRLLTFLVTTAVSVLLFTLGYYYIDNRRQDSRLIGTINSLQRDLLFSTKECEILKEELTSTKSKLAGIEDSSFGMDDMVQSLKEEINELKAQNDRLRNSLDDNEKLLRVSENTASELQNTLSEVENTLSELLAERANTEEHIAELNGKLQAFEEELISVSRDRDNFQLKYVSAESALEETKKQKKILEDLNQKISEANNTVELQKHEIVALKDVIKELKSGAPSDVDVNSLIDHTEIKAKLSKATEEKDTYMTKYELEHKERVRLTEELSVTQESLQTTTQQATEALTRLEVLGKYFQERESELMKELSAKESLWLSKQGESASTVEKMEVLQQEAQRYKEKCDALTLELAEQESSRRTAISEIESRAHTAWLEARQAKREADAARDEAATLRRKLASMCQADGAVSPHRQVGSPLEVGEGVLPPPMLPLSFLPPPMLPPLPRPPPLGRLPSPHPPRFNERRYSPDSRYSPLSQYSPEVPNYPPMPGYPPGPRYSPESRYSPEPDYSQMRQPTSPRRERYSPRSRRPRSRSRERYSEGRGSRARPADTETEYNSDSPSRRPRRRPRYIRASSGRSSISSCSSESEK